MYRYFIFSFFIIGFHTAFAQYKIAGNDALFKKEFTVAAAGIKTIAASFTQIKSLTALSEKLTSKGSFYFQKDNKVRMEYTSPYPYLMVINGTKIMVKDGTKTNTISTRSSKTFQRVNQLMMDCMNGNIFNNKDFTIRVFEDESTYLTELTPITLQMKNMFSKVNVIMKKSSFVVQQVQMFEPSGDYTSINYTNQKLNIPLADALFTTQ